MKRHYLYTLLLAALVFLSANLPNVLEKAKIFDINTDPLVPVLPETPYNYDIPFPSHVLFGGWDMVDSSIINNLITPDGATLGRVLFYDKKLSSSNELACATCHKQAFAFADNTKFSIGINETQTTRNSPNLNDLAWQGGSIFFGEPGGNAMLFWDCRENNLDNMVLQPILHQGELGKEMPVLIDKLENTTYYPELFQKAFGTSEITADRIGLALAQFVRSMSVFDSKFDKVMMGQEQFTQQEEAGRMVFESSCGFFCHTSSSFAVQFPLNNGLDSVCSDIGYQQVSGFETDNGKFKTPSLRNLSLTAPYMHDGRFATIEEVIDFYSEGLKPHPNSDISWMAPDPTGFHFTNEQKADLKAFLLTLNSTDLITDVRWSDPFQPLNIAEPLPLGEKITVFPNPFNETTKLELTGDGTYEIRLTNLNGHVLRSFKAKKGTYSIERSGLSPGVYLLEVHKSNRVTTQRVVLQ